MGEGGVACVCLQAVMDKFPDTNGKMDGKPVKRTTTKRMKLKRDAFFKKEEPVKTEENAEVGGSSGNKVVQPQQQQLKDEVEEGELGTLKSPKREVENGEFVKSEVEKGEFVGSGKWRKDQGDRGKVLPATWRKMDFDRGEYGSGRLRSDVVSRRDRTPERFRKGDYEKGEFGSWRGVKDEVEKGEFIPDRWHKGDAWGRDEYGYSKRGKLDSSRDREYRYEYDWTPSYKYSGEDISPRRDFSGGGGGRHMKRAAKWEANQERNYPKLSSKVMDEVGSGKNEYNHGRGRDFSVRLKRHGADSDSSDRKYYDDNGDHVVSSKSRKLGYSDHLVRHSSEKAYRNPNSSSSRNFSARLSGRPYDSSSKRPAAYDRQRRSPSYSERSPPRERARYHDFRDITPAYHEKSPCYRIHRHDNRNRSPNYVERSPQDRGRPNDYRDRSPSYEEPSLRERMRPQERRDRSPSYLEPSPHERMRSQERRDRSPSYFDESPHERMRPQECRDRSPSYFDESPHERMRSQERRDRSPSYFDESPHERMRPRERRDRSPSYFDESPHERMRPHERRDRSPSYFDESPHERTRPQERRDRSPSYFDESPHDRGEPGKTTRSDVNETKQSCSIRVEEEKHTERNHRGKDSWDSSEDRSNVKDDTEDGLIEKAISHDTPIQDQPQSPNLENKEYPSLANGSTEELPSMEEDMDICDTPPHVPSVANVNPGKWYYLDHHGAERGPSRLCDLKALVEGGILMSDHLVKHSDTDRWVTVENAASPLVTANYTSIFSDSVTQLASPPEAPGNVLLDAGDVEQPGSQTGVESSDKSAQMVVGSDDHLAMDDLRIDDRVCALFEGKTVTPGRELEIVEEVLQVTFDKSEWERFGSLKGFTQDHDCEEKPSEQSQEEDVAMKDSAESTSAASFDKECGYLLTEFTEWFSGRWSCKGGDWKRNEEAVQDKYSKRKLVLNDGYPLCQMPKSGFEDPRWQKKEDLYFPCQSRRLDLPAWAFSCPDERNDAVNKLVQSKPVSVRGVKGTMLPVIRINACVVNDHGSFVSDPRLKIRGKDKYSSKSSKHYSSSIDVKRSSGEEVLTSKSKEHSSVESWKCSVVNKPKDRLCAINDLQLQVGDWYYLDGTGQENGPFSSSVLQTLVEQGFLKKQSSVFRKVDKLWVPVISVIRTIKDSVKLSEENTSHAGNVSGATDVDGSTSVPSSFNSLHPQYIGYTRGRLHELVMRFYKSREFAAAINEVLDPWINSRQPKKELERHLYIKPTNRSSFSLQKYPIENGLSLHEDDLHSRKRCRISIDGAEEGYDLAEGVPPLCYSEPSFEDLCRDVTFSKEENEYFDEQFKSWGLLDGHILARIFHFLRADVKSLVFAALSCKHWRAAVGFYKSLSVRIDLSTIGTNCSDHVMESIMRGYNKKLIKALVLDGCSNITSSMLEAILQSFSYISSVDIRGCSQFEELIIKYPHVNWVRSWSSQGVRIVDESNLKTKSLKQMAEQPSSVSKSGHGNYIDESSGLKDYFDMVERRGAANQAFRQNLYKRTKLVDARKSASVLAREARMRHWAMKKAGSGYKKMEEFLLLSLNDIMKGKSSDYFAPKVAEIENRIKTGYYARRGLSSAKQDIIKMCRAAMNMKNRGDGDMEVMIALFIKLGTCLDESLKAAVGRDEMMRKFRDEVSGSFGNKKYSKTMAERKYTNRANGSSFVNGGLDHIEYSSEREIRKKLSRMNKKMESESDSSDEYELSSDDALSDTDRDSNSETDSDIRSEGGASESKDGCITADEYFDSTPDDREWGARMTKASLVPPVTRKYEVIDQYVIVADEEEVQRKMRVSLPDDYEDKVKAQKNGSEEVDMEIPEVKEYKPRKQLGEEVIEQEVYGIDPYTHNLLLDSMPEDGDWQTQDKHNFIEDVLLRVLNKQVRHYTGSGSTPMTYPLKPVVEEVLETAKLEHDMRIFKLCEALLQAIDSRTDDNYVAYRKGLGVVCNKQGGFTEDDFVVEFLGEVYPAWKWFEKQDGVRSLQKNSKEPAPEFYNIHLERPKGDADGYDLVVVDAMHKANYASRICHSCRPNCEAKVTAVSGHYQIGIYSLRPIAFGEEITFDYNSVTESKEEYEASVCLCGSQVCRGSYLNLTGEGAYQKVLKEWHGLLVKHHLLLEACELNWVSEEDYIELGKAGLGSCLLGDLPDWLIAFSARLVRFMNFERSKLPEEILRYNLEEKKKYYTEISVEFEKNEAEVQAEGVYNQRLQNLALTLDKVRYVLRCVFGDPKKAPPPLQKLSPEETVSVLWNGEDSLVKNLLDCIAPHLDDHTVEDLKSEIRAHDPSNSSNIEKELKKSLLWLRDEVRNLPCTYKSRHDAAADLIHLYAYTKCFFKIREYKTITSSPVHISPLDLGPKCANKLSGVTEYCKTYGENYCLGQLIYWHNQANADPDRVLARTSRGCLSLPDISSFYAKAQKPSRQRVYGPRTVRFMLARMEKQPQRPWPKDRIWSFETSRKFFGSPMLDAVMNNSPLEKEMVNWLKNRPAIFQAKWDR